MEELSVADVLDLAAELLAPEGAWIQGVFARDAKGRSVGLSSSRKPTCYCIVGATSYAAGDDLTLSCHADDAVGAFLGVDSVSAWNDAPERTQAEVVTALRQAALKARAGEGSV